MKIRLAESRDSEEMWNIFTLVVSTGETYAFPRDAGKSDFTSFWFGEQSRTYVIEKGGEIFGMYVIKPNQAGPGSHIANGSYMVHPDAQGQGLGAALCKHSLSEAKSLGYRAMQFNLVVSTNEVAVALWKKFGFEIIGTIPEAFDHVEKGFVDAYIMHRTL